MGPLHRTAVYATVGFAAEVAFSAIHDLIRGDRAIKLRTSPWMLPIYALIAPLYEPLHDKIRRAPAPIRAASYGIGFLTVEYVSGRVLRTLRGEAPWDYTYARVHIDGLVRPVYFFYWAAAGLALENLHDALTEA